MASNDPADGDDTGDREGTGAGAAGSDSGAGGAADAAEGWSTAEVRGGSDGVDRVEAADDADARPGSVPPEAAPREAEGEPRRRERADPQPRSEPDRERGRTGSKGEDGGRAARDPARGRTGGGDARRREDRGRRAYPRDGVGDVFSKPATMAELKRGLVLFGSIGVGLGLVLLVPIGQLSGGGSGGLGSGPSIGGGLGAGLAVLGLLGASLAIGPAVGGLFGLHAGGNLRGEPRNQTYATAALGALLGGLVLGGTVLLFAAVAGSGGLDAFLVPLVLAAVGAALAALGGSFAAVAFGGPPPGADGRAEATADRAPRAD